MNTLLFGLLVGVSAPTVAEESIWIEAEHLQGIQGFCWPSGTANMRQTKGHWGLSGPGWAAEWVQGGESGFLSIACGADDDKAIAFTEIDVPREGTYHVWVRFRDNREATSRFQLRFHGSEKGKPTTLTYGSKPIVDEDNEMKLYWNWAFAWERAEVKLPKGKVKLELLSGFQEKECRQIDCISLTTDAAYRPRIKDRPRHPTTDLLESLRKDPTTRGTPLAKRTGDFTIPEDWKIRTFRDKGFLYLWNIPNAKWASDDPKRILYPFNVADKETLDSFEKKYGGAKDVPIFSDPRITPIFIGPAPYMLETESVDPKSPKEGKPNVDGRNVVRWLEQNPDRCFGTLLNYQPDRPINPSGKANFLKYRERFVGGIAGENLGYFNVPAKDLAAATQNATNRRELAEAISKVCIAANAEKYRTIYGEAWRDAYREVIPCQSVSMTAFAPLSYSWGARTVGYESSAITNSLMSMRWAFLRGAARQHGGMTATYRSSNFGDSATIFSDQSTYSRPRNILDNYYSVYSGAGMTWYKFDIWYQYMSGSSMFYHEQGFDEFWRPGGTAAAGFQDVQLSPKGKLVDRFLRVTAKHPDRGTPFTPMAFLVDYAHGWDPAPYHPHAFDDFAKRPTVSRYGDHERMLHEYFWTAFYPIGPKGMEQTTGTSEAFVPGLFGDRFDVIYAYPEVQRWKTIDRYPVVIVAGDIALSAAEGKRLADYVEQGGTLLIADSHLTGPGVDALKLPAMGTSAESEGFLWKSGEVKHASQRFHYRPITGGTTLAETLDGKPFCSAFDRGKGRLIVLSIPRGLGIDHSAHPAVAKLMASLGQGLMPIDVSGDVEWMLNRTSTGWLLTILNPAGAVKPQQGILPTDSREDRKITIRSTIPIREAVDRLSPSDTFTVTSDKSGTRIEAIIPAGSVRVLEVK